MLRRFVARSSIAIGLAVSAISTPAIVSAETGCPIQVEPRETETKWHEKGREAESLFAKPREIQHDCRSIRIEVQPEGNALLTFTTTDGRIAVRLLHSPDDIASTIEALLVTSPVDKPLETPARTVETKPDKPAAVQPGPSTRTNRQPVAPMSKAIAPAAQIVFRGLAGLRLGIEGQVFAPAIGLQAAMQFAPWELGFGGEFNPQHLPLAGSAPAGYSMRSFQGHFLFGRIFPRQTFSFRAGASIGVAIVHEETDSDPGVKGRINIDAFQPRVGVHAGAAIPREGRFRFYLGLLGDMAVWGVRANGTIKRDLPNLSRFGLGLSLGVEVAP